MVIPVAFISMSETVHGWICGGKWSVEAIGVVVCTGQWYNICRLVGES